MKDIGQELLQAAVDIMAPLTAVASNPPALVSLLSLAGWDLNQAGLNVGQLATAVGALGTDLATIEAELAGPLDLTSVARLLPAVSDAVQQLSSFASGWTPPQGLPSDLPETLIEDILGQLLVLYLGTHPVLRSALEVLGLLDYPPAPQLSSSTGQITRAASNRPRLNLQLAGQLFSDPGSTLMTRFGLAGEPRLAAADVSASVFPFLADLAREVGLQAWYGDAGRTSVTLDPAAAQLLQRTLRINFFGSTAAGAAAVALDVAVSLADEGSARVLSVVPTGTLDVRVDQQVWTAEASLTGTIGPVDVQATGVTFTDPAASELSLTVSVSRPAGTDPMVRLGTVSGPRFEVGGGTAQITADLSGSGPDVAIVVKLSGVHIVVPTDGDAFLSDVLPPGVTATCDLTLTWDRHHGLQLNGAPGITVAVPVGLHFGPVTVGLLRAAVSRPPSANQAGAAPSSALVSASLGVDVALALGPVAATISNVGIGAQLSDPSAAGQANLGVVNLDMGFKPPDGVGLAIDAGPVSGGGFLSHDPATGRYAGALELRMESLALKAIGLLDTRLPDGSAGYSLIVIITAEFEAIQLGFGFTLTGVGGLAGINRTVVIDALRAGVRAHRLSNILFPPDPIGHAGQILSDMAAIFPPDPGNYVFGPMVKLGWGTPAVLTLELGLLLELPPPLRLIVLGRIALNLPDPDAPLVRIQMDSLGVVDFGTGQVAIDAVLFDSNVAGFALTGSMALRAAWLGQPGFTLAIGGFNPGFTPPAQFPALDRVTIALASGNNPRLRLSAYLALTSNTAQIGARLDLFVQGPFGITLQGELSFDALFQFDPFQFVVGIGGSVTIMSNGQPLLSASAQVTLTGPNGWHVQGQASFSLFGFSVSVSFDTTIGSAQPLPAPPPVQLAPLLEAALTDPANWAAALPADASTLLTFSAAPVAGKAPAHPLAGLAVHQRVLPLDIAIQRYGSATPADPGRFAVTSVTIGTAQAAALSAIDDWFAPGQFLQLSDADSLQRPSFEQLHAGVAVTTPAFVHDTTPPPAVPAQYRTMVYDTLGGPPREVVLPGPASMPALAALTPALTPGPAGAMAAAPPVAVAAASGSPAASRGRARFLAPSLPLQLIGPRYALATTATLAAIGAMPPPGASSSWTATAQNLAQYLAASPGQAGQVQLVAGYEVR